MLSVAKIAPGPDPSIEKRTDGPKERAVYETPRSLLVEQEHIHNALNCAGVPLPKHPLHARYEEDGELHRSLSKLSRLEGAYKDQRPGALEHASSGEEISHIMRPIHLDQSREHSLVRLKESQRLVRGPATEESQGRQSLEQVRLADERTLGALAAPPEEHVFMRQLLSKRGTYDLQKFILNNCVISEMEPPRGLPSQEHRISQQQLSVL